MKMYNSMELSGTVIEKTCGHAVVKSCRSNGKENTIVVWNLPKDVYVGDSVVLYGKVKSDHIETSGSKLVVGMDVMKKRTTLFDTIGSSNVKFSGTVYVKGTIRDTPLGKRILDMTIKVGENNFIPIIIWGRQAEIINDMCRVGDEVEVHGFLMSREYEKVYQNGESAMKVTTEVSVARFLCI